MNCSEKISELATALAIAQGEMTHAKKESVNPHFKSKYADLSSVWDAIREPLSKNGLCVTQLPMDDNGKSVLLTVLMHKSGEFVESHTPILSLKNDAQGYGSALTYARRYALASIIGISQDDDDGNDATKPPVKTMTERATSIVHSMGEAVKQGVMDQQDYDKIVADIKSAKRLSENHFKTIIETLEKDFG